jgi:hypothetical protein
MAVMKHGFLPRPFLIGQTPRGRHVRIGLAAQTTFSLKYQHASTANTLGQLRAARAVTNKDSR